MWSTSASGGSLPCCFHTTIGTPHTSQSATQQVSSSWYHSVIRAASHSSHAAAGAAHAGVDVDGRADRHRRPAAGDVDTTVVRPGRSVGAAGHQAEGPAGRPPPPTATADQRRDGDRLGPEGDLDGHRASRRAGPVRRRPGTVAMTWPAGTVDE